jgi:phosphomannomutase
MDEKGNIIPMDMITALVAEMVLKQNPGASIYYDLRSSWSVKEVIEENGGKPLMSRVGHAFIKQQMREANALFAGELSGHYYFKENFFTESSSLAALYVANLVSQSDRHCPAVRADQAHPALQRQRRDQLACGRREAGAGRAARAVHPAGRPGCLSWTACPSSFPTGGSTSGPPTRSRCAG